MGDYGFGLLQTAAAGGGSGGGGAGGLFGSGGGTYRSGPQYPAGGSGPQYPVPAGGSSPQYPAGGSGLFLPGYPPVMQDELLLGVTGGKHIRKELSPGEGAPYSREELHHPGEVSHAKAEELGVDSAPDKLLLPASPSSSSSSSSCSSSSSSGEEGPPPAGDPHASPPSLAPHKSKLQMEAQGGHLLLGSSFPGAAEHSPGSSPSLPGFGTPWSVQTSSPPPPQPLAQQQPAGGAPHPANLNALHSPEPDSFYPGIPSSINPAFFHSFSPVSANPCPGINVPGFQSPFSAQINISQQQQQQQSRRSPVSPQLNPQHHQAAAYLQQRNNYNHHQVGAHPCHLMPLPF